MDAEKPFTRSMEPKGGRWGRIAVAPGITLRHAHWPATARRVRGVVVLCQGRSEFIEKYFEVIGELRARGFEVWTLDWRGQGLSSRLLKDPYKGHIDSFRSYLDDFHRFLTQVVRPASKAPWLFLGHSMGAHVGLRYLRHRPGLFAGAVTCAPFVGIADQALPAPRRVIETGIAVLSELGLAGQYFPGQGPYDQRRRQFEGNDLTGDPERFSWYARYVAETPALAIGGFTVGWAKAAHKSITTLTAPGYAARIECPVLILSGEKDRSVPPVLHERFAPLLPHAQLEILPDSRHEILMERDVIRARFWAAFDRATAAL